MLDRQGWSVWWDKVMDLGTSFDMEIERELEQARCVIVLWSRRSVASRWVRSEARLAAKRHVLVPALIEPSAEVPLEFSDFQAVKLTEWRDSRRDETTHLVAQVASMLGREAPTLSSVDLRDDWEAVRLPPPPGNVQLWLRVRLSCDTHDVMVRVRQVPTPTGTLVPEVVVTVDGTAVARAPENRRSWSEGEKTSRANFVLSDGEEVLAAELSRTFLSKHWKVSRVVSKLTVAGRTMWSDTRRPA